MKKLAIFFLILVIIVAGITYMYLSYKSHYTSIQRENVQFENYYNKNVYGADLATIINKAVDNNIRNNVQKDKSGNYIENDTNSIKIDIKMIDDDNKIYSMEKLYNGGMDKFVEYYSGITFRCTQLTYHKKTNRVKYMLFEQITQ